MNDESAWSFLEGVLNECLIRDFEGVDPSVWHGQPDLQRRVQQRLDKLKEELDGTMTRLGWYITGHRHMGDPKSWGLIVWNIAREAKRFQEDVRKILADYGKESPDQRRSGFKVVPRED